MRELTGKLLVVARVRDGPRIVAVLQESAALAGKDQAVGAVELLCPSIHTLPIAIAVGHVGNDLALGLAGIWLGLLLGHR